jgi:hypothetical protein
MFPNGSGEWTIGVLPFGYTGFARRLARRLHMINAPNQVACSHNWIFMLVGITNDIQKLVAVRCFC